MKKQQKVIVYKQKSDYSVIGIVLQIVEVGENWSIYPKLKTKRKYIESQKME